ncbi:hypothetical protein AQS8620_02661 [Aquimixticola soesokkakensis]|uniref:Uncharacterized protein n=2 Tax=Aquimixticola soesokkakensis TaxID=1519096 RepID=A0A1Y5TAL2_9RHOB|nr:hypothetical protein AQS8620_02661 [Aquimixticola soesokkakensis]
MIVAGVPWLGLSLAKPGWNALSQTLPEEFANLPLALALTICGMMLATLGKMIERRAVAPSPPIDPLDFRHPEVRRRWHEAGERLLTAEKEALGDHFGRSQERVALRPCWPQRETDSWVGGLPLLPENMDWPVLEGQSASFLAQISLSGMPDGLWQGAGPRKGWLVFFAHPETCVLVAVRHVYGNVAERPQPADVVHNWHWIMEPEGLKAALGKAGQVPPRWYLERAPSGSLGAVEDMVDCDPAHWDDEAGNYVWEPTWTSERSDVMNEAILHEDIAYGVDWDSLTARLAIWWNRVGDRADELSRQLKNRKQRLGDLRARYRAELAALSENPQTERATYAEFRTRYTAAKKKFDQETVLLQGEAAQIERALQGAEAVAAEAKAQAAKFPFSPERGRALKTALDELYDKAALFEREDFKLFMENYARHLYCRNSATIPDLLLNLYGPLWETQCRETVIFIGLNAEGTDGLQGSARLIDIPSHPLAGLAFGDESRFYVDLKLEDLVQAKWQNSVSLDTHGGV